MDRARRRSGLLICALAGGLSAPAAPPLHALRWLEPGADGARILTERPVECLARPADAETGYLVEVGRAAFRTPLTLGGQAARVGIACETCHRNGRTNSDFDFPGLSGGPGTADVTSFLMSSHRGDHIDNPKRIPDLGGPKASLRISQSKDSNTLERFIHGLVTEEFDGAEPPPTVLKGLAAYVRALSPSACPQVSTEPLTAENDIGDARRAVRASLAALGRNDRATAESMALAARSQLGALAERYAAPGLADDSAELRVADLDLAVAVAMMRRKDPESQAALEAWLARSHAWSNSLARDEPRSLYDRLTLASAIKSH